MLTDAVVAIAMTLLVLPLLEFVPEVDIDNVWASMAERPSLLLGYVLSFVVIYLFWAAHHWVFEAITDPQPSVRVLNLGWLLAVAFLPFPTALIGREPTTSSTPIYIGTILCLSVLTGAMTTIAARSVEDPNWAALLRTRAAGLWWASAVILICGVIGSFNPDAGLFGLLTIIPIRALRRRRERLINRERAA